MYLGHHAQPIAVLRLEVDECVLVRLVVIERVAVCVRDEDRIDVRVWVCERVVVRDFDTVCVPDRE